MQKIRAILCAPGSGCRVWRNNVGELPTPNGEGRIKYGLGVGSADLVGLAGPIGRFVAIEVKTPKGRLSNQQTAWLETIRGLGGIAEVIRSVEEAKELLRRIT